MGRGSAETTTVVNPAPLGLSHSFHVHAPVLAIELNHRAVTTQLSGVFLVCGRPVRRVKTIGIVVKVSTGPKFVLFGVDDGSDCLNCVVWRQGGDASVCEEEEFAARSAEVPMHGQLVRLRGRLGLYQGQMQVTVSSWESVTDSNEELLHWMDAMNWAAS